MDAKEREFLSNSRKGLPAKEMPTIYRQGSRRLQEQLLKKNCSEQYEVQLEELRVQIALTQAHLQSEREDEVAATEEDGQDYVGPAESENQNVDVEDYQEDSDDFDYPDPDVQKSKAK